MKSRRSAGLAAHIEQLLKQGAGVAAPPITRVDRDGPLPLSFAQQRLWFIDKLERGSAFYNLPLAVTLSGHLDVEALERTLTEVVRRHEVLRTHFVEVNGEPVQVIEGSAAALAGDRSGRIHRGGACGRSAAAGAGRSVNSLRFEPWTIAAGATVAAG